MIKNKNNDNHDNHNNNNNSHNMKTTYCVKCKTNTDNIDPKMFITKNNRLLMQSKCSVCKNKKSLFVKEQDAKGLLNNLGIHHLVKFLW